MQKGWVQFGLSRKGWRCDFLFMRCDFLFIFKKRGIKAMECVEGGVSGGIFFIRRCLFQCFARQHLFLFGSWPATFLWHGEILLFV